MSRKKSPFLAFFTFIKRLIGTVLFLAMLFIFLCVGINAYVFATGTQHMTTLQELQNANTDYIVVLGAGLEPNGTPSPMLAERIDEGIALYQAGAGKKLLFSGDGSLDRYYNEALAMKKYAIDRGIPSEAIMLDEYGLSTYDSIHHLKSTYMADQVVIVSQRYHLYRAAYLAQAEGLEVYVVASDKRDWPIQEMREFPARIKDFTRTLIPHLPEPLQTISKNILLQLSEQAKQTGHYN